MSYKATFIDGEYEVENTGDGEIIIDSIEHQCPQDSNLENGCRNCGYSCDYKYNPDMYMYLYNTKTHKCEEIG